MDLEILKADKTLDFQAHKLYYTATTLVPTKKGGTKITHNYKVRCPFYYFDSLASKCEKCAYYDGNSHNGIYCLAVKYLKLTEKKAFKKLKLPKHFKKERGNPGDCHHHKLNCECEGCLGDNNEEGL